MTDKQLNNLQFWIFIGIIGAIILAVLIGVGSCIIDNLPKTITYKDLVSEKNYSASPEKVVVYYNDGHGYPTEEFECNDAEVIGELMDAVKKVEWNKTKYELLLNSGADFYAKIYYSDGEITLAKFTRWYEGDYFIGSGFGDVDDVMDKILLEEGGIQRHPKLVFARRPDLSTL